MMDGGMMGMGGGMLVWSIVGVLLAVAIEAAAQIDSRRCGLERQKRPRSRPSRSRRIYRCDSARCSCRLRAP